MWKGTEEFGSIQHCNIGLSNIMLNSSGVGVLIDFPAAGVVEANIIPKEDQVRTTGATSSFMHWCR